MTAIKKRTKDFVKSLYQNMKPNAQHFNEKLPYRLYDKDSEIFHNSNSISFAKELTVLSGGNDTLSNTLNKMISSKLPTGNKWHYQFVMTGDHKVQEQLDHNRDIHSKKGGIYSRIAKYSADFADMSATEGFPNRIGQHARFDLKNYRSFMFCTTAEKNKEKLNDVRSDIETELNNLGITSENFNASDLINYTRNMLNHNAKKTRRTSYEHLPNEYLCKQMTHFNTRINQIQEHYTDIEFQDDTCVGVEEKIKNRVVCLSVSKLPSEFHMCQLPSLLSSSQDLGNTLRCPFSLSLSFQIEEPEKSDIYVKGKLKNLRKWQKSPMRVFMALIDEEITDYTEIQKGLLEDYYRICYASIDLILYSTEENYKVDVAAATSVFRQCMDISVVEKMQAQALLAALPFNGLDLYADVRRAGRAYRIKSSNVAAMLPIVAEWKAAYSGILVPGARNQIAYLTPFDFGTDNFNIAVAGASGSGKSVLIQTVVDDVISRGGVVYINDMGESYKRSTLLKGGQYMNYKNIRLNPFTHLDRDYLLTQDGGKEDFANSIDLISGLISSMASPTENISNFRFNVVKSAVMRAYDKTMQQTNIDHVVAEIDAHATSLEVPDCRITDLIVELRSYTTTGEYGDTFNLPSILDPKAQLVCLEINGFPERILQPVMLAQIINISNRIYLTKDDIQKLYVIEEAWSSINSDNVIIKKAIEKALRTFRKHNASLIIVTQNVQDYYKSPLAEAIYEISDIKLILRQGDGFAAFVKTKQGLFSQFEIDTIKNFRPSAKAGFSSILVKAGSYSSEHHLFLDPFAKVMTTTNAIEVNMVEQYQAQGLNTEDAIEKTAWDLFPDEMKNLKQFQKRKYENDKVSSYVQA